MESMNVPGLIALIIGLICIAIYLANWLGKRKAREEPIVQARVTDSQQSEWRSSSVGEGRSSTSYIVKTTFNVPLKGSLNHTKHFGTKTEAEAWAARFTIGSWHAVTPHPYAPGEVFLQEELLTNPPTALVVGLLALAVSAGFIAFG
jgi:hypothetical protein